jgi:predicted DNA-binding transcriptional regulator AlpA
MTASPLNDGGCTEESNRYLSAPEVMRRLGVSQMSLWRYLHNSKMKFPRPYKFSRNRFWSLCELIAWEKANKQEVA